MKGVSRSGEANPDALYLRRKRLTLSSRLSSTSGSDGMTDNRNRQTHGMHRMYTSLRR